MQRTRAPRFHSILLCGCAVAPLPACGEAAEGGSATLASGGLPAAAFADELGAASPTDPEGLAGDCLIRTAGAGRFASVPVSPASTLGVIDFDATATTLDVGAVVGLSRGAATSLADLAGAVRLAPGGAIDAGDGVSYRADQALAFQPDRTYRVRMVADLPSHTYSVYVHDAGGGGEPDAVVRIARGYALRPPGAHAASLDALSAIAEGPAGQLSVCGVIGAPRSDVVYSREGSYAVAPLPGDQALASDGSTTWRLGARGQVLAQVGQGGEVAADEAGNVYVARASGGQLVLHAFTPRLAPRWSRVDPVEPFAGVQAIAADAAGVTIALATAQGVASIRRFPAGGAAGTVVHGGATLAVVARDGFAVATTWQGGVSISLHDLNGSARWSRSFDNEVTADVMTLGLDGRVVLGGRFSRAISFGGPTLELAWNGEVSVNSYAVALARADGAHAFTTRIPTTRLTGAAASAGRVVIAGETWVTPIFPHLWQLDPAGRLLPGEPETGFYEQWGRSGRVAIGASNRIYWERSMVWPSPTSPPFPYLLAITP